MITIKTKRDLRSIEECIEYSKESLVKQISKAFLEYGIQMPEKLQPLTNSTDVFGYRYDVTSDRLSLMVDEEGKVCVKSNLEDVEDNLNAGFLFDLLYIAEQMMHKQKSDDSELVLWCKLCSKWHENMQCMLIRFINDRMWNKKWRELPVYGNWDSDDVMQRFCGLTTNGDFEWRLTRDSEATLVVEDRDPYDDIDPVGCQTPLTEIYIEELLWIARNV